MVKWVVYNWAGSGRPAFGLSRQARPYPLFDALRLASPGGRVYPRPYRASGPRCYLLRNGKAQAMTATQATPLPPGYRFTAEPPVPFKCVTCKQRIDGDMARYVLETQQSSPSRFTAANDKRATRDAKSRERRIRLHFLYCGKTAGERSDTSRHANGSAPRTMIKLPPQAQAVTPRPETPEEIVRGEIAELQRQIAALQSRLTVEQAKLDEMLRYEDVFLFELDSEAADRAVNALRASGVRLRVLVSRGATRREDTVKVWERRLRLAASPAS